MQSIRRACALAFAFVFFAVPAEALAGKGRDAPQQSEEKQPFKYEALDPIPVLPRPDGGFPYDLKLGCEAAARLPEKLPDGESAVGIDVGVRAFIRAKEQYKDANTEESDSLGETLDESAQQLVAEMLELKQLCQKIKENTLDDADLDALRAYRNSANFRGFVEFVERYAQGLESGNLRAALSEEGDQQGGAAGMIVGGGAIIDQALNGLADFLVKRAKEEAILAIQEEMKTNLCKDPAKQFLLDTCKVLMTLDGGLSLRAMGTQLHAAAVADLRRLPDVSLAYLSHVAETDEEKGALQVARLGYMMAREVVNGRAPVDAFAAIHAMKALSCEENSCKATMEQVRKISALVYVLWTVNFAQDVAQLDSTQAGVVFAGAMLASEKHLGEYKYDAAKVKKALGATVHVWAAVRQFEAISADIAKLLDSSSGEDDRAERRELAARIITQTAIAIRELDAALVKAELVPATPQRTKAIEFSVTAANVVAKLIVEDWGAAALATVDLLSQLENEDLDRVLKIVPLIVEIANAESSEGVALAIEAAAAPVGSYRAKYEHWTISLNGFVGVGGGLELISSEGVQGWSGIAAGVAPIGLHVAKPVGRAQLCKRCKFHVGGALTMLDLGALTTYRFKSELAEDGTADAAEAEPFPQVNLAAVFSPGAYFTVGLFKSAAILGIGASMSPRLRRITDQGFDQRDVSTVRLMAFLAVDVTLYQIR